MRISLCSMPSSRPSVAPSIVTGLLLPRPVSPVPPLAGSLLAEPLLAGLAAPFCQAFSCASAAVASCRRSVATESGRASVTSASCCESAARVSSALKTP